MSRRILRIAAILACTSFSATVWIEFANRHWTHIGGVMVGGFAFLMVLGALIAILDGEGV